MSAPTVYSPPQLDPNVDLDLSKNEGQPPNDPLLGGLPDEESLIGRYPDLAALRGRVASLLGVGVDRLLVTAGGDDALFRCFLARDGARTEGSRIQAQLRDDQAIRRPGWG